MTEDDGKVEKLDNADIAILGAIHALGPDAFSSLMTREVQEETPTPINHLQILKRADELQRKGLLTMETATYFGETGRPTPGIFFRLTMKGQRSLGNDLLKKFYQKRKNKRR